MQSSPPVLTQVLTNDLRELERLAEAVEQWAADIGLEGQVAFHVNLALDEILTNTITYGYDDDRRHTIDVSLSFTDGAVQVRVADDGRPFDPFTEVAVPDPNLSADERAIGGLGLHLVRTFMSSVAYRREGGRNLIYMTKVCEEGGVGAARSG